MIVLLRVHGKQLQRRKGGDGRLHIEGEFKQLQYFESDEVYSARYKLVRPGLGMRDA